MKKIFFLILVCILLTFTLSSCTSPVGTVLDPEGKDKELISALTGYLDDLHIIYEPIPYSFSEKILAEERTDA